MTDSFLAANAIMATHLAGALLLGVPVGYERSYQGRAAGMRTYGLGDRSSRWTVPGVSAPQASPKSSSHRRR